MPSASSPYFSACMPAGNTREPASGLPSSRRSLSVTVDVYGSSQRRKAVRRFTLRFQQQGGVCVMSKPSSASYMEILLVEDNPGDVVLTKRALRSGKVLNNLHVVNDGTDALAFLRKEGKYEQAPRPDLVLLDLNLPKVSGREV